MLLIKPQTLETTDTRTLDITQLIDALLLYSNIHLHSEDILLKCHKTVKMCVTKRLITTLILELHFRVDLFLALLTIFLFAHEYVHICRDNLGLILSDHILLKWHISCKLV